MRKTPSAPSIAQAVRTPRVSSSSETNVRTTTVPSVVGESATNTGTRTSAPPGIVALNAAPARERCTFADGSVGEPMTSPSGKITEVPSGPVKASTTAVASSGETPAPGSSDPATARVAATDWEKRSPLSRRDSRPDSRPGFQAAREMRRQPTMTPPERAVRAVVS